MITGDELLLIAVMPDDSASIEEYGNTQAVRDGHNSIIRALENSRQRRNILFRTQLMSGSVVNNWVPLEKAKPLTEENYQPDGGTPLYDSSIKLLGSSEAEMYQARKAKKTARFGALIMSDGEDTMSEQYEAADVNKLVTDIFRRNDPNFPNTLAFMGLPNTRVTSYRAIANSMGIKDERTNVNGENVMQIITPEDNARAMRRAVDTWSRRQMNGRSR